MKDTVWKALSIVACLCMLAAAVACVHMGGCDRQLITTEGGTCYMRCYWCFRASSVLAAVGALSCLVQALMFEARARRGLACVSALVAVGVILLNATPVIGVCGDASMICHQTALVVNILCAICIVLCLIGIVRPVHGEEKPKMGL